MANYVVGLWIQAYQEQKARADEYEEKYNELQAELVRLMNDYTEKNKEIQLEYTNVTMSTIYVFLHDIQAKMRALEQDELRRDIVVKAVNYSVQDIKDLLMLFLKELEKS